MNTCAYEYIGYIPKLFGTNAQCMQGMYEYVWKLYTIVPILSLLQN